MENKDQTKLNDLIKLLDFHTQMENKGMMSILESMIDKLVKKERILNTYHLYRVNNN